MIDWLAAFPAEEIKFIPSGAMTELRARPTRETVAVISAKSFGVA